jgi:hypothetical protein
MEVSMTDFLPERFFVPWEFLPVIEPHGRGNIRVLTVGPPDPLPQELHKYAHRYSKLQGFPTQFTTISAAMDAIPLMQPGEHPWFISRWTILVTPGWYLEEVRMKPYVNIVGLSPDTVFICPPRTRRSLKRKNKPDARATVYMNHFTSIRNVAIAKPAYSKDTDYAIWNKDTYDLEKRPGVSKTDVSDFSAFDVPIWPFPNKNDFAEVGSDDDVKKNNATHGEYVMGKSILMEGNFSTAFMVNVGASYNHRRSFDVEISGQGQNADCHVVGCFFDSLFLDRGEALAEGGCIDVSNCYEVHIRNSLLRVGADFRDSPAQPSFTQGAAVRVRQDAMVLLEGSTLYSPGMGSDRVLHVDKPVEGKIAGCIFAHSSADSVLGKEWVAVKQGLP